MEIRNAKIDGGDAFDWGRTSADYARFRDIYPPEFYEHILRRNCGTAGQRMLDLGTGTGVLPRNLVQFGGIWTGTDISENQIAKARELSAGRAVYTGVVERTNESMPWHRRIPAAGTDRPVGTGAPEDAGGTGTGALYRQALRRSCGAAKAGVIGISLKAQSPPCVQ